MPVETVILELISRYGPTVALMLYIVYAQVTSKRAQDAESVRREKIINDMATQAMSAEHRAQAADDRARDAMTKAEAANRAWNSLAQQMADSVEREAKQKAEMDVMRAQVADLTTRLEVTAREADKVPGMEREIADLRAQLTAVQKKAHEMDAIIAERNATITKLEGERATLKTDLDLARERTAALEAEVTALKAQLAALAPTSTVTVSETTVSEVTVSGTPPADAEKTA